MTYLFWQSDVHLHFSAAMGSAARAYLLCWSSLVDLDLCQIAL
jgi:hypothetical protein